MGFLWFILVGAAAGWLAGRLLKGGFGLLGDVVVGVIGAFVGAWLFGVLKVSPGSGVIVNLIVATIGAIVFLSALRLFKRAY
jgi:uncharacterized membrane protein YeaQ/YmgE (transglycosylase-associated protein family)